MISCPARYRIEISAREQPLLNGACTQHLLFDQFVGFGHFSWLPFSKLQVQEEV